MDVADLINDTRVYGMWVHRNIKAGDELTIDYVNTSNIDYHNKMRIQHNFICQCTNEFIMMNSKRALIHKNLGATFRDRDRDFTASLVDKFLGSKDGREHAKYKKEVEKIEKQVLIC